MNQTDPTERAEFARQMAVLCAGYGEELTEARLTVYAAVLADLPLPVIRDTVLAALRTRKFFPRPAELLELAGCGLPDVGLVEAMLTEFYRRAAHQRRFPDEPFLRLVVERLGGPHQSTGMTASDRIFALGKILPAVCVAAQARGLALPNEATAALSIEGRAMAQRSLDAAASKQLAYDEPTGTGELPDTMRRGGGSVTDILGAQLKRGLR